jgi:flagellar biosynthesis protein FliP
VSATTARLMAALATVFIALVLAAAPGAAAPEGAPAPQPPAAPAAPAVPGAPAAGAATSTGSSASISLDPTGPLKNPSQSVMIIIALTLLAVAPAMLIMMTSFTRIVIVLSLTRNALGLQSIPPNQVVVGLALFLSLFVMSPTIGEMNKTALQPLLKGELSQGKALQIASVPIKGFMLSETRKPELAMFVKASANPKPDKPESVPLPTLIPAFVLSELKTAFIIGFIVFVPFLVIDLIVSSSLMSMGMMMLPPVLVSLPFKLLLFVMVDGWALVVRSLLTSFKT